MAYNITAIMLSIVIPGIIIIKPLKELKNHKINSKDFIINNKVLLLPYVFLVIGLLVRSLLIDQFPTGLNVDEASAGYEAFSISNYGIDRNGNFLPVFLEAWGSGQNALYTYIMIPFIKILGLNIISTRLPMVILSCATLFVWYFLLKRLKGEKFATLGLAFLVICPWHIMKSRWGLESNVFPDLMVLAVFFIVRYLQDKKTYNFFIAFVILGLTGYAYGTSYLFLPVFVIMLLIYLLYKEKITIKNAIISFLIILLIALPIMLYVVINTFDLQQINLGFCTIPKLPVNRYEEQTSLFEGDIIHNSINNFTNSISMLTNQNDNLPWNSIQNIGMYYLISTTFIIIGLSLNFKKGNIEKNIINIWFVAAFILLFVFKSANINRINILIFPIIYYIIVGIEHVINTDIVLKFVILTLYLIMFVLFIGAYIKPENNNSYVFTDDVREVITYVSELQVQDIYIENAFKEPYIYVLYYTQYNTHDFVNTVKYFDYNNLGKFDNVKSFGKYKFYLPENLQSDEDIVYVLRKNNEVPIDYENFKVTEFEKYIVLEGEK